MQALFPTYKVKTTGHSLGAALAFMAQMSLIKDGFDTTMINFGQPRCGDKKFAEFASAKRHDSYRVVHYKDQVPHLPPKGFLGYHHATTEAYEDLDGSVRTCDTTNGEDPTCMDQWGPLEQSWDYHTQYLGFNMAECSYPESASTFLQ